MRTHHEKYMRRCLQLALNGEPTVSPNPMVGSVVVHQDRIIGEGWHYRAGKPHAEVNALEAVRQPELLRESTLYISLEPCSHHGTTPPCTDKIIKMGIPRVVIATRDSNSAVKGKGVKKLQEKGVDVIEGVLEEEAQYLNRKFFSFHQHKRPYVLLKWAQSMDGFMDKSRNEGQVGVQWITRPETRIFVHRQRSHYDAILVGADTVINDNPLLGIEEVAAADPQRIVIDPRLRTPESARVYRDDNYRLYTRKKTDRKQTRALPREKNVLREILRDRYVSGTQSIMVEGGAHTLKTFIDAGLWDEAMVLVGHASFGHGLPAPRLPQPADEVTELANDTILTYYRG